MILFPTLVAAVVGCDLNKVRVWGKPSLQRECCGGESSHSCVSACCASPQRVLAMHMNTDLLRDFVQAAVDEAAAASGRAALEGGAAAAMVASDSAASATTEAEGGLPAQYQLRSRVPESMWAQAVEYLTS